MSWGEQRIFDVRIVWPLEGLKMPPAGARKSQPASTPSRACGCCGLVLCLMAKSLWRPIKLGNPPFYQTKRLVLVEKTCIKHPEYPLTFAHLSHIVVHLGSSNVIRPAWESGDLNRLPVQLQSRSGWKKRASLSGALRMFSFPMPGRWFRPKKEVATCWLRHPWIFHDVTPDEEIHRHRGVALRASWGGKNMPSTATPTFWIKQDGPYTSEHPIEGQETWRYRHVSRLKIQRLKWLQNLKLSCSWKPFSGQLQFVQIEHRCSLWFRLQS